MSSFKEKLSKSGQSVLDAEEFPADASESINLDDAAAIVNE